jgi:8-oxo-dGTP pyrophosphatase MutT (NUDIX family)
MSSKALLDNPEALKAFLKSRQGTDWAETEEEFRTRVGDKLKDEFWGTSMQGPSVFFGQPDPSKITEMHPSKKLRTELIKINLSKLLKDHPGTRISGTELVPYDPKGPEHQGHLRHKDIGIEDVRKYTATSPEELWKHYNDPEGKRYAGNVPHAQIITPTGGIDPKYIEKNAAGRALEQLKRAKYLSDNRMYREKHQVLQDLIRRNPKNFYIDSHEGNIVGITHRPTNFRIHMPLDKFPSAFMRLQKKSTGWFPGSDARAFDKEVAAWEKAFPEGYKHRYSDVAPSRWREAVDVTDRGFTVDTGEKIPDDQWNALNEELAMLYERDPETGLDTVNDVINKYYVPKRTPTKLEQLLHWTNKQARDVNKLPYRPTAEAFLRDNKGNLVAYIKGKKNRDRFLKMPGGGIDPGESPDIGLAREIKEETGITPKNVKLVQDVKWDWPDTWAQTDKQKKRYKKFRGEHSHIYTGDVDTVGKPTSQEGDAWDDVPSMDPQEAHDFTKQVLDPQEDLYQGPAYDSYKRAQLAAIIKIMKQRKTMNKQASDKGYIDGYLTKEAGPAVRAAAQRQAILRSKNIPVRFGRIGGRKQLWADPPTIPAPTEAKDAVTTSAEPVEKTPVKEAPKPSTDKKKPAVVANKVKGGQ